MGMIEPDSELVRRLRDRVDRYFNAAMQEAERADSAEATLIRIGQWADALSGDIAARVQPDICSMLDRKQEGRHG